MSEQEWDFITEDGELLDTIELEDGDSPRAGDFFGVDICVWADRQVVRTVYYVITEVDPSLNRCHVRPNR